VTFAPGAEAAAAAQVIALTAMVGVADHIDTGVVAGGQPLTAGTEAPFAALIRTTGMTAAAAVLTVAAQVDADTIAPLEPLVADAVAIATELALTACEFTAAAVVWVAGEIDAPAPALDARREAGAVVAAHQSPSSLEGILQGRDQLGGGLSRDMDCPADRLGEIRRLELLEDHPDLQLQAEAELSARVQQGGFVTPKIKPQRPVEDHLDRQITGGEGQGGAHAPLVVTDSQLQAAVGRGRGVREGDERLAAQQVEPADIQPARLQRILAITPKVKLGQLDLCRYQRDAHAIEIGRDSEGDIDPAQVLLCVGLCVTGIADVTVAMWGRVHRAAAQEQHHREQIAQNQPSMAREALRICHRLVSTALGANDFHFASDHSPQKRIDHGHVVIIR
jgi:hypothetical protein